MKCAEIITTTRVTMSTVGVITSAAGVAVHRAKLSSALLHHHADHDL
jgi:hypothetical protein